MKRVAAVHVWMQRWLLLLFVGVYAAGTVFPAPALALRGVTLANIEQLGDEGKIELPMLLLATLLFVAGLSTKPRELSKVARSPFLGLAGTLANVVLPLGLTLVCALVLRAWPDRAQAQSILVGLALIAAMPIGGASTAWAQNARASAALSLGLVWISTVASPGITPLSLRAVGAVTEGRWSEALYRLASDGSSVFVIITVLVPSLLGLAARLVLPTIALDNALPVIKLVNLACLLLLNYCNSSKALPQLLEDPDWVFIACSSAITTVMCVAAFAVGWWLPKLFKASHEDRVAMTFGLGMNNNGTGLTLAAKAFANEPFVLVPIIIYNLVQQLLAALVTIFVRKAGSSSSPAESTVRA